MSTSLYNISADLNTPADVMKAISVDYACARQRVTIGLLAQASKENDVSITLKDISKIFGVSLKTVYNNLKYINKLTAAPSLSVLCLRQVALTGKDCSPKRDLAFCVSSSRIWLGFWRMDS